MSINIIKKYQFSGHRDGVYRLQQAHEPHKFFSAAGDGMVVLWDLTQPDKGELIARLPNSIYAMEAWEEENIIIAGHNYDGIHLLDWKSKKERGSLKLTDSAIFDIKLYKNFAWIATGNGDVVVADIENLSVIHRIELGIDKARTIAINKENGIVAVGYSDNAIRIFDVNSLLEIQNIKSAHENSVFDLNYSPDNHYLYSCGRDAKIKRWSSNDNYQLDQEVAAHMYTINHLTFSPNGEHFVSCSMDKSIKVWQAEQMRLLKVIDKGRHASHGTSVNRLLWTSYNNWLISASDDHSIAVWEITF